MMSFRPKGSIKEYMVSEVYFGTNEYFYFSTKQQYLDSFQVATITEEHAQVLWELFGESGTYGIFPLIYPEDYADWEDWL
jgi:hypothetical protein